MILRDSAEVKSKTNKKRILWLTLIIWNVSEKGGNSFQLGSEQSTTYSTLPIYTESTPKAKRRSHTNRSNMQLCIRHTARTNCSGSTFNETGVISQASVGEYCLSVLQKRTNSTMTFQRLIYTFALNIFKGKVPAIEIHLQARSVCFAVDRKLISSVPPCESGP